MGGETGIDGKGIKMGISEGSSDHKKDDGKGDVGLESWVESNQIRYNSGGHFEGLK